MPRNDWPIIVGGCYRSGTSLVRRILNAHSRIYCGPEVKFFRDFYGNYFHDPIRHLRFTTSARNLLPEPELLKVLGGAFVTLQERAAEMAGKPRWADKNPENVLYLDQWQRLLGEEWLMVHVVRNPLDTLASIKEMEFPLTIPAELDARTNLYNRYIQAGTDFGSAHPDRYHRVLYEELVSNPAQVVYALMSWLDECFEPEQRTFNNLSHQSGLEDPKVAKTSTIHRQAVGRWRELLTPEEATQIAEACGPVWRQIDPVGQYKGE